MSASRVMDEIDQVMAMIDAAAGSASTYSESLSNVTNKLGNTKDRDGLRAIVESLVATANEMKQNNEALEQRLNASKEEINQLQENLAVVRTESLTDPLTGLSNRKHFDERLAQAIEEAAERSEALSLVMTDIDHFKAFNDTWGHLTGDQVLRLVAMSLKQNVKGQDIAARYGGEEFAVILPNTVLRSALTVADHIRRAVMSKELMKRSTGQNLGRVTISLGVATAAQGRHRAVADRARRRLPLCGQAQRPQPGDLRDRSGVLRVGAKPRSPDPTAACGRFSLSPCSDWSWLLPACCAALARPRAAPPPSTAAPIPQARPDRRRAARASASTT